MFGFSLPKLLFTILVVVVVVYGFKAIGRLQERRESDEEAVRKPPPRSGGGKSASAPRATEAEDMVACPACGTYVAAHGARSCGRADCPYPG